MSLSFTSSASFTSNSCQNKDQRLTVPFPAVLFRNTMYFFLGNLYSSCQNNPVDFASELNLCSFITSSQHLLCNCGGPTWSPHIPSTLTTLSPWLGPLAATFWYTHFWPHCHPWQLYETGLLDGSPEHGSVLTRASLRPRTQRNLIPLLCSFIHKNGKPIRCLLCQTRGSSVDPV